MMECYYGTDRKPIGPNPIIHVAVIGSIAVGKSRFLKEFVNHWLAKKLAPVHNLRVFWEPVTIWQHFGQGDFNYLGAMYRDPGKHAFEFQLVAASSKRTQLNWMEGICLVERTFGCQQKVFLPILKSHGHLNDRQVEILEDILRNFKEPEPDLLVYLTCDPEVAETRIAQRGREEEMGVSVEYLKEIEEKYSQWMDGIRTPMIKIDTSLGFNEHDLERVYANVLIEKAIKDRQDAVRFFNPL
jgi:deoxyadenosine/deoxycytidine kinase